jgi:hypothetical protein
MSEILRDPLWQFIGVILALIAIGVSILIYLLQRNRKSLSYEVLSDTPFLTMKEELEGKLQILYEGTSIKNAQLIVIRILNSGNMPIPANDYERPLQFVFGNRAKILSAEVTDKVPDNLLANVTVNDHGFELKPTLLNSKDSITVKVLVSDYQEILKADARIIGVKSIQPTNDFPPGSRLLMLVGLASLMVGMFHLIKGIGTAPTANDVSRDTLALSLIFLLPGYIISFIGMFRIRRYRKLFPAIIRGSRERRNKE